MKVIIVNRPSSAALAIVKRKTYDEKIKHALEQDGGDCIGICQGSVLEVIAAGDIAEKTSDVIAGELSGSCPQHTTCLVIVGKTSAVVASVDAVKAALCD